MASTKRKKRRKGLLPQTKAVRFLATHGWVVDPAERKMGKVSKDWGGFADIIAIHPRSGSVMLLQVTSVNNFSSRVKKVLANENARALAQLDYVEIVVWGHDSAVEDYAPQRSVNLQTSDFTAAAAAGKP